MDLARNSFLHIMSRVRNNGRSERVQAEVPTNNQAQILETNVSQIVRVIEAPTNIIVNRADFVRSFSEDMSIETDHVEHVTGESMEVISMTSPLPSNCNSPQGTEHTGSLSDSERRSLDNVPPIDEERNITTYNYMPDEKKRLATIKENPDYDDVIGRLDKLKRMFEKAKKCSLENKNHEDNETNLDKIKFFLKKVCNSLRNEETHKRTCYGADLTQEEGDFYEDVNFWIRSIEKLEYPIQGTNEMRQFRKSILEPLCEERNDSVFASFYYDTNDTYYNQSS
jgi:hypothetical protein